MQLIILILLIKSSFIFSQVDKQETIPLEQKIKITITEVDTTLDFCDVYQFEYREQLAQFWTLKSDINFVVGETEVNLCRIIQWKFTHYSMRGCDFYNGFSITNGDSLIRHFDFDEFGDYPKFYQHR